MRQFSTLVATGTLNALTDSVRTARIRGLSTLRKETAMRIGIGLGTLVLIIILIILLT